MCALPCLPAPCLSFVLSFEEASGGKGASLQNYNNELVKCIDDLREKREEVNRQILASEEEKAKIQKDLSILTERLQKINENLVRKTQARNEYDKTIQETEAAYMKVRAEATLARSLAHPPEARVGRSWRTGRERRGNGCRWFQATWVLSRVACLRGYKA